MEAKQRELSRRVDEMLESLDHKHFRPMQVPAIVKLNMYACSFTRDAETSFPVYG
jgi:hypothetical protein